MFCKYCGNEIPEGQTCGCEAAVAAQNAAPQQPVTPEAPVQQSYVPEAPAAVVQQPAQPKALHPAVKAVLDAFKAMPVALKHLLGNTFGMGINMPSALIFVGGSVLLHVIAFVCLFGGLVGSARDAVTGMYTGMFGSMVDASQLVAVKQGLKALFKGIYGMAIWAGFLSYVIPLAIGNLIPLVGQLVRKEDVNFKHNFIVSATAGEVPAVLLLVGALLAYLSFGLGLAVIFLAAVFGMIVTFKMYAKQVKNTSTLLGGLGAALAVAAAVGLVAWIVSSAVTGYFSGKFLENLASSDLGISDISDLMEIFSYLG